MWEHRAVSHKQFKESGRITPTETYVQLMDKVEDAVKEAQKMPFDHEEFLNTGVIIKRVIRSTK